MSAESCAKSEEMFRPKTRKPIFCEFHYLYLIFPPDMRLRTAGFTSCIGRREDCPTCRNKSLSYSRPTEVLQWKRRHRRFRKRPARRCALIDSLAEIALPAQSSNSCRCGNEATQSTIATVWAGFIVLRTSDVFSTRSTFLNRRLTMSHHRLTMASCCASSIVPRPVPAMAL